MYLVYFVNFFCVEHEKWIYEGEFESGYRFLAKFDNPSSA